MLLYESANNMIDSFFSVYYYNFAWRDYSTCGLRSLLDAVKVLAFAVSEGRVAIHCHAGIHIIFIILYFISFKILI